MCMVRCMVHIGRLRYTRLCVWYTSSAYTSYTLLYTQQNMARNPHVLTIAEERFCSTFVETGSGTEAFERAYGYSQRTSCTNADRVMKKPVVQLRIMELRMAHSAKLEVSRDTVLNELVAIAFAPDISTYLDYDEDSVRIRPLSELTPTEAKAIKSVTTLPNGSVKLEFHDRLAAMAQLCKVLGLASGDTNISLNHFVIKVPEAVATGVEWEAIATAVAAADEVETAMTKLPAAVAIDAVLERSLAPVEDVQGHADVSYRRRRPWPASGEAPEPPMAPVEPPPGSGPCGSPLGTGRDSSELQQLPQPIKLGGHRRGY